MYKRDKQLARVMKHVAVNVVTGCWEWLGYCDKEGYAKSHITIGCGQYLMRRAHVVVWWLVKQQPVPDGLDLDHLCRNRKCVNPDHMEPVTEQVNTLRGTGPSAINARKTHCINGHPLEGDNLYLQGGKYGISRQCRICKRERLRRWRSAQAIN